MITSGIFFKNFKVKKKNSKIKKNLKDLIGEHNNILQSLHKNYKDPQNTKKILDPISLCCAFSFTNENIHINKNIKQINSNLMKYFLTNCAFLFYILQIHLLIEYL